MARKTILFQNTGKKNNYVPEYWQEKQFWFSILAKKTILVQYTGKKNNSGLVYWKEKQF